MAASTTGSNSLKEYLKRYENTKIEDEKKKKKKEKKKPELSRATGLLVVDEDPIWQKAINVQEEEGDDSADEEKPQVDEDIEVRRMKRLEQLRLRRPYNAIAEDGSGWVSLDSPKPNSDMSPPRRQRSRNDTPSPEPAPRPSGSGRENADLSPPRQRQHRQDTPSPRSDSKPAHSIGLNSDLSPPRKRRARNDASSSQPELMPMREDSDLSPPRQRRKRYHSPSPELDSKPGQFTRLDSDLSPPRKRRVRNDTPSPEPEPKPAREDTDISPPRRQRGRQHISSLEPDISASQLARRSSLHRDDTPASDTDLSPPRKNKRVVGKSGLGDPSRSHGRSSENDTSHPSLASDLSPPRKNRKVELSAPASSKGPQRTGLITGSAIQKEISKTKDDEWMRFQQMDPSITGQQAEAVYRDKKKGGRISKDEYLKSKQKGGEKPEEKKLEWGKGLAQRREAEARLEELEQEKDKPFARTRDDPDLDNMLKDRLRWGDPMAHLVKKKHSHPVLEDLGDNEKMKESGFIIPQDVPSHSWIKRGLDAAPNRYGIRPGRHWDGVDRSTGYEQQMFKRTNEKRATEKEAYLWSVSDM